MRPSPSSLIEKKRDGGELTDGEIASLIDQFMSGDLTDYQMSAWLMAAYLRGLTDQEMVALTQAMLHSGQTLQWARATRPKIDKHSTGGVGDKISLPLAPLVAVCGLSVPMISGRGLGHTGGTLDKLESIPGYRTRLSPREFERIVQKVGVCIMGQTDQIAPADRRIYALRDVTGTVASRPLIVASILSKKLAAGLDGLVLDVKVGRGAFMKDPGSARALAKSLVHVATRLGTPAVARITSMHSPLGWTIGNALEVRESIDILRGAGPADTTELTLALGEEMLLLSGLYTRGAQARTSLRKALDSGAAAERFAQMIEMQGGDPRVVDQPKRLPQAPKRIFVKAARGGYIHDVDPLLLADVALRLGAGRLKAGDAVDPAVGIELAVAPGQRVEKGQILATLHVRKASTEAALRTREAFKLASSVFTPKPLLGARIAV